MATTRLPKLKHLTVDILLKQYEGDKTAVHETLEVFYEQFSIDLPEIKKARDPIKVRRLAHKMKTGVMLMGLGAIERELDALANTENRLEQMELLDVVYPRIKLAIDELEVVFAK